jgi:hypothetical protein
VRAIERKANVCLQRCRNLHREDFIMLKKLASLALAVAAIVAPGMAMAADITFTGNYAFVNGTGNGPIQGVLSLQQQGSTDYEYGYSGWSVVSGVGGTLSGQGAGAAASWSSNTSQVHKSIVPSGYFAQSVGALDLAGINGTNLALAFQVNAQGTSDTITIHTFDVVFIRADGLLIQTLTYTPDGHSLAGSTIATNPTLVGNGVSQATDNGTLPGVGQGSSGWLYTIDVTKVLAVDPNFFDPLSGNRIGMNVPEFAVSGAHNFSPTNDGSDNFYFTTATGGTPPVVPVPAAAWSGMALLAGLGVARKLRRQSS